MRGLRREFWRRIDAVWERLTAYSKLQHAGDMYAAAHAELQRENAELHRRLAEQLETRRMDVPASKVDPFEVPTKPKLVPKPCSIEDRSKPPPGYSVHERHVDVWWANADLGSQESRAEAVAAAWEHHDAIAERAREQGWNACLVHLQAVVNVVAEDAGNDWSVEDVAGFVEEAIHDEGADDLRERAEKAERERDEAQQRLRHLCVVAKDISGRSDPDGAPVLGVVRKALKQLKHERDEARELAASASAKMIMRVGALKNQLDEARAMLPRQVDADELEAGFYWLRTDDTEEVVQVYWAYPIESSRPMVRFLDGNVVELADVEGVCGPPVLWASIPQAPRWPSDLVANSDNNDPYPWEREEQAQ